jgi:hypothetical protein
MPRLPWIVILLFTLPWIQKHPSIGPGQGEASKVRRALPHIKDWLHGTWLSTWKPTSCSVSWPPTASHSLLQPLTASFLSPLGFRCSCHLGCLPQFPSGLFQPVLEVNTKPLSLRNQSWPWIFPLSSLWIWVWTLWSGWSGSWPSWTSPRVVVRKSWDTSWPLHGDKQLDPNTPGGYF